MEEDAKLYSLTATFVQPSDDAAPVAAAKPSSRSPAPGSTPDGETFPCTGTSWSATGSVLFASYVFYCCVDVGMVRAMSLLVLHVFVVRFGRLDHSGWCTHRAGLGCWNVFKKDFTGDKPTNLLETSVPVYVSI